MKKTILIVEDDEDIRNALSDLLTEEGYEVTTAAHGREALDRLARMAARPSLILFDWMMPVMNGRDFTAALQLDPDLNQIPLILLTAAGKMVDPPLAVRRTLRKPIDVSDLFRTLDEMALAPEP